MSITRVGWVVAAVLCALPLASVLHPAFSVSLQAVVLAVALIASLRPLWGIGLLVVLGPLAAAVTNWLGSPPISGNEMLQMLVLAVLCGSSLRQATRPPERSPGLPVAWVLAAVFATSAIVVTSVHPEVFASSDGGAHWLWVHVTEWYFTDARSVPALHHGSVWLAGLGVAALAAREIRRQPVWGPRLAHLALAGLAVEAGFSWQRLSAIAQRSPEPIMAFIDYALGTRISPHYPDINAVGSLFALATTGWLAWVLAPAITRGWRAVGIVGAVLCGGALWLTQSRAAFMATAIVAAVAWVRLQRPTRRTLSVLAMAVLVIAALATLATTANVIRVSRASAGDAARVRIGLATTGLRMAADSPLFGVGVGEFRTRAPKYTSSEVVALFPVSGAGENAHNQWIQVLGETGVTGLLAFCAFWCGVLLPIARQPASAVPLPAVALAAGLSALLLSALLGHPFLTPVVTLLTLLVAGILYGLSPVTAGAGRTGRWIAAACIAALVISLPIRIVAARRAVDLDNVVVGATPIVGEQEGVRFRRADPRAVLFVRTNATVVEIPLRAESGVGCHVTVSVDGNPADEVMVTTDRWQRARFHFREPETRWNSRRVDVRTSSDSCQLLIGRVVVID